jgi:cytochrome P450
MQNPVRGRAGHRPDDNLREIAKVRPREGIGGTLAYRRDPMTFLQKGIDRHGDIFRFHLLGMPIVLVNHPDYIRQILVDKNEQYDKDVMIFRIVRPVLRNGLIAISDLELWRRQRRMMAPHFAPRTVRTFTRNMTDEATLMIERWERHPDTGVPLEITDEIGQLALRIVNRSRNA